MIGGCARVSFLRGGRLCGGQRVRTGREGKGSDATTRRRGRGVEAKRKEEY